MLDFLTDYHGSAEKHFLFSCKKIPKLSKIVPNETVMN